MKDIYLSWELILQARQVVHFSFSLLLSPYCCRFRNLKAPCQHLHRRLLQLRQLKSSGRNLFLLLSSGFRLLL